MTTKKRTPRLVKGSLEATLRSSRAVDRLQSYKRRHGNSLDFCYVSNVEDNWDELVGKKALAANS